MINKLSNTINDIILKIIFNDKELKNKYNFKYPNTKYTINEILPFIFKILQSGITYRDINSYINWNTIYRHKTILDKHNVFKKSL